MCEQIDQMKCYSEALARHIKEFKEAVAIVEERQAVIGGLHSGANENESWVIEEADGSVANIHEE